MEKNSKGLAFFVVVFIVFCCIISCCVLAATMLFNSDFDSDVNFSVGDSEYSNYDKAEITLERQPCFGFCADYTLTLTESGDAIFEGGNYVKEPNKTINYQIDKSDFEDLINSFEDVDFLNLNDEYVDPYVTDLPGIVISLRLDNKFKSIKLYGLDDTVPQNLNDLADEIDSKANTKKYIETTVSLNPIENIGTIQYSLRNTKREQILNEVANALQQYFEENMKYPESIDLYTNLILIGTGYDGKSISLDEYLISSKKTTDSTTAYCYYVDALTKDYHLEVERENEEPYVLGNPDLGLCSQSQYLVPKDL